MFIESVFSGSVLIGFAEPPQTSYAFGLNFSGRCGAKSIGNYKVNLCISNQQRCA